jgi:hypothetical protein
MTSNEMFLPSMVLLAPPKAQIPRRASSVLPLLAHGSPSGAALGNINSSSLATGLPHGDEPPADAVLFGTMRTVLPARPPLPGAPVALFSPPGILNSFTAASWTAAIGLYAHDLCCFPTTSEDPLSSNDPSSYKVGLSRPEAAQCSDGRRVESLILARFVLGLGFLSSCVAWLLRLLGRRRGWLAACCWGMPRRHTSLRSRTHDLSLFSLRTKSLPVWIIGTNSKPN